MAVITEISFPAFPTRLDETDPGLVCRRVWSVKLCSLSRNLRIMSNEDDSVLGVSVLLLRFKCRFN